MTRRDVWRIDRAGSLNRLARRTEDLPPPASGEAQVAVKAIGLNFADVFACLGLYSATPAGSFIPGLEFAGVVEAIGPRGAESDHTHGLRPGDLVVGLTRFGGYATAVNAPQRLLRPVRPGWDAAQAVALPAQGLTAWYGLVTLGAIASGDAVLLHSAAGGVGLNALAILGAVGARTVATVGSEAKRQWLVGQRRLSKDQVVVRDPRTFGRDLDRALAAIGAGAFDVVFDAVSGPYFTPGYERLAAEGRLVVYGAADFMSRGARPNPLRLATRYLRRPRLDPLQMISANRSVMAFNLIWLWDRFDRLTAGLDALDALIAEPPLVGRRYPFADAPAAVRHLQSGHSVGKIVLEVDAGRAEP